MTGIVPRAASGGAVLGAVLAVLVGCAEVPKDSGFADVQSAVGARTGTEVRWRRDTPEDEAAESAVRELLKRELGVDAAVQVALLNNPALQARYEALGVSQADLVQAGLLSNPIFGARARFPDRPPSGTNIEVGIVENFLDLLLIPARKQLAALQFEEAKLRVTSEVVSLAARTRVAYFAPQAAEQESAALLDFARAAEAASDLAKRIQAAGGMSELGAAGHQAFAEQAKVELARSRIEAALARERLNGLLGLWGPDTEWKIPERLPDIPETEAALDHLESLAVSRRADLAAARKETEVLAQALGTTRAWRWLGAAEVGVSGERDTGGQWVAGPSLALGLPIFDQRQAAIARGESLLRQSEQRFRALAVDIRAEVRAARGRLLAARELAEHYRTTILPLQERIVALSQQHFNFMQIGAFELVAAKQAEIRARQDHVRALRDYWIARSDLELAVGGTLPAAPPNATGAPPRGANEDAKGGER